MTPLQITLSPTDVFDVHRTSATVRHTPKVITDNEPTARAIAGLERALAGLGLLDEALSLDLRRPQDYFHRVWSTNFPVADLTTLDGADDPDGQEIA